MSRTRTAQQKRAGHRTNPAPENAPVKQTVELVVQGQCPRCGAELEYGRSRADGETLTYDANCRCGWYGQEVYSVEFSHFWDSAAQDVIVPGEGG